MDVSADGDTDTNGHQTDTPITISEKAKTTSFPVLMSHFTSFYHPAFFCALKIHI
jgi:hypothetical protein